jgi:hypothetical protein
MDITLQPGERTPAVEALSVSAGVRSIGADKLPGFEKTRKTQLLAAVPMKATYLYHMFYTLLYAPKAVSSSSERLFFYVTDDLFSFCSAKCAPLTKQPPKAYNRYYILMPAAPGRRVLQEV